MTQKVLLVDDDPNVLSAISRGLRRKVDLVTAEGGAEGLEAIKTQGPFAVVISDQQMPQMDGTAFLKAVKDRSPLSTRMMLTGNADQGTAIKAVNEGAIFRFLNKPCATEDLQAAIHDAVRHHQLVAGERELLEKTLAGSIKLLIDILSVSDPLTFREVGRVRKWAATVAPALEGVDPWELDMAVLLSRIGHVLLPADIQQKLKAKEELSDDERDLVNNAPEAARDLLGNIPRLEGVAAAVLLQNRNFDGSGEPGPEAVGDEIPLTARILKILLDLSTTTTARIPSEKVFAELEKEQGHYDPSLLHTIRTHLAALATDETGDVISSVEIMGLSAGDELMSDVKTSDGRLLLSAGNELTDAMVKKLRQFHKVSKVEEPISVRRLAA